MVDLGDAVVALQLAQPPPPKTSEETTDVNSKQGPSAMSGILRGAGGGAGTKLQGPSGHGVFNLPRGNVAASF